MFNDKYEIYLVDTEVIFEKNSALFNSNNCEVNE